MKTKNTALVWDLPLRLFHWLLVAGLFGQWLTAEILSDAMTIHFYLGYFTLGLILFRIIWGLAGTRYARFWQFLKGPKAIWQYATSLFSGSPIHYTGHNPLGGLWVPLVILLVGLQATSGLFVTDDVVNEGPYYASAPEWVKDYAGWIHHNLFNVLLGFIALHLVAISWYQLKLKYPMLDSMISGKKTAEAQAAIPSSAVLRAIVIAVVIAVFVYWLVEVAPPEPELEVFF